MAETDRRLDQTTSQIAKLSSTVTDQESNESNIMLVVRGFSEAISAETPGPQNDSGITIVTTAFDQDKLNLEKKISQARSRMKTIVSNKI